jgi:hypothetical protein
MPGTQKNNDLRLRLDVHMCNTVLYNMCKGLPYTYRVMSV